MYLDSTGRKLVDTCKATYVIRLRSGTLEVRKCLVQSMSEAGIVLLMEDDGKLLTITHPERLTVYEYPADMPEEPVTPVESVAVSIIDGLLPAWRQAAEKAREQGVVQDFMAAPQVVRVLEVLRKAIADYK